MFIVAGICFVFSKCPRFTKFTLSIGDEFTFTFILVSLGSIIKQLSSIIDAITKNGLSTDTFVASVQSIFPTTVSIWIIIFGFILLFMFVWIIYDNSKTTKKRHITKTMWIYYLIVGITAILWVLWILVLSSSLWFLFLCLVFTIGMFILNHKFIEQTRSVFMENKDKAKESAYSISQLGSSMHTALSQSYPDEIVKGILSANLNQLEMDLKNLRDYSNTLK
jgi:hypothetical protein